MESVRRPQWMKSGVTSRSGRDTRSTVGSGIVEYMSKDRSYLFIQNFPSDSGKMNYN